VAVEDLLLPLAPKPPTRADGYIASLTSKSQQQKDHQAPQSRTNVRTTPLKTSATETATPAKPCKPTLGNDPRNQTLENALLASSREAPAPAATNPAPPPPPGTTTTPDPAATTTTPDFCSYLRHKYPDHLHSRIIDALKYHNARCIQHATKCKNTLTAAIVRENMVLADKCMEHYGGKGVTRTAAGQKMNCNERRRTYEDLLSGPESGNEGIM
jgi:hypothetical protein